MKSNGVIFKGTPNGISILLDENIDFEDLKEALVKKLVDNLAFFKDATTSINFKGRELSEEQEIELIKIISKNSGLDISYVFDTKERFINFDAKKVKPEPKNLGENANNFAENINLQRHLDNLESTYYHKGSVRGGQCLSHSGSIVVIGDVNPGSKIIAEGNIIILGKLKGIVHAGCSGIKNCFVSALFMSPTQLIINDVITYFPDDIKREMVPEYAYEKDGKIFVEQLVKV